MKREAGSGPGRGRVRRDSPRQAGRALRQLAAFIGPQWPLFAAAVLVILGSAAIGALLPARIGLAVRDHVERTPDAARFTRAMLANLLLFGAVFLCEAVGGVLTIHGGCRVLLRLRSRAFEHVQTLSMAYFDRQGIGDVISRVNNDIGMMFNLLVNGFASLVRGVFLLAAILLAMLILNLPLCLIVLAVTPLMVAATGMAGRRVRGAFRENQAQLGRLNAAAQELVGALSAITAFNRQEESYRSFEATSRETMRAGVRAETAAFVLSPVLQVLSGLALALLVGAGGTLVLRRGGVFSVGLLASFIIYARNIANPLRQLASIYTMVQSALAGAERVFELFEVRPEVAAPAEPVRLQRLRGDVQFQRVCFGYLPEQVVLEEIDLAVQAGQKVAVVGPTGAGKTTLVNLLSRFYDVRAGRILVDGVDIRTLELSSLRTQMGVVLQEPFLFAATVRENILYGNPGASEEQLRRAARLASADGFIGRLPQGYDTVLQERGLNLSQGERQLLGIARAVLAEPRILILDEATSSVDSLTEALVQEGLEELMRGRTCFIIAHRLSTIRGAHQVLVLHDHRILERGTHAELLKRGGFYARLYAMQLSQPEVTEEMEI